MMMVVAIVAFIVGISFPAVTSGLDSIRLRSSTDTVASFLNGALNRAERRQEPVELTISARENTLALRSADGQTQRQIELTGGITIENILPGTPEMNEQPRQFIVQPGGVPPAITVELANRRGERRRVRVDPITGAPEIERTGE
jgi:Tfp pilus assembly protein FimT